MRIYVSIFFLDDSRALSLILDDEVDCASGPDLWAADVQTNCPFLYSGVGRLLVPRPFGVSKIHCEGGTGNVRRGALPPRSDVSLSVVVVKSNDRLPLEDNIMHYKQHYGME